MPLNLPFRYTPLIDMNSADPDTMLTAMVEAARLTNECGQEITIFRNDHQLYKVAVHNITWVYPDRFQDSIPRVGGMHMLMSFIGSIGHIMPDSGLQNVMKSAFGEQKALISPTSKLWHENLVKPILIMMGFVGAEREGKWPLHLCAVQMLPYFFAAGHHNYARYGLYCLFTAGVRLRSHA